MERGELAKAVGIPPFVLGKYTAQSRRYTKEQLRQTIEELVNMEELVKTGRMGEQVGVELMIVKYSSG